MPKYTVDIYSAGDAWVAAIPGRIIVGAGKSPGEATSDAIRQAEELQLKLQESGVLRTQPKLGCSDGPSRILFGLKDYALRILIGVGLPAVILGVLVTSVFLTMRPGILSEIKAARTELIVEARKVREALDYFASLERNRAQEKVDKEKSSMLRQ